MVRNADHARAGAILASGQGGEGVNSLDRLLLLIFVLYAVFTDEVETAQVDYGSMSILVNPGFFSSLEQGQKRAIALHEASHFVTSMSQLCHRA